MDQEADSIEEQPKGPKDHIKRWLKELSLSEKADKDWMEDAQEADKTVRNELTVGSSGRKKETFNILWANVETKRPALFNSLPRPDIRRRFRDKDKIGKAVSEVLERACTVVIEPVKPVAKAAVNDMLVPGRANIRVRYKADVEEFEPEEEGGEPTAQITSQDITWEQVQYGDFRHGPGKSWDEVTWIGFKHRFTKAKAEKKFGEEIAELLQFEHKEEDEEKKDPNKEKNVFARVSIWEIWDKETRKILWICEDYKDSILLTEDDPLNLSGFWPIPKPLLAIPSSTSLKPVTEYSMYRILARELETATKRINKIVDAIRVRGFYDPTLAGIEEVFESEDNAFIAAKDLNRLIETGGIDKAIWMMPIRELADVLVVLRQQRRELIQEIYEITGISDILRGDTNPNETLGAQEMKANYGSQRLNDQRADIQNYFAALVQITVEIIGEHFERETLQQMTGLNYPTRQQQAEAKQQIALVQQQHQAEQQARAQMAMQTGQPAPEPQPPEPPPPEMLKMLDSPTWEDIEEVIQSDLQRLYRIDIETDSTVQADQQKDQRAITELLTGIVSFMQGVGPAIQSGVMTLDIAKNMLLTAVRRHNLGRELEDSIEDMEAPKQPENDGEQAAQQMEMQMKQMEMQAKKTEMELKGQIEQAKAKAEMDKIQMEAQIAKQEHEFKMQLTAAKMQQDAAKFQQDKQRANNVTQ